MSHLHKALALLTVVTAMTFGAGIGGDFVWDDRALVVENAALQEGFGAAVSGPFLSEQSGHGAYWRPVVSAAFWIQHQLFGSTPTGYHVVSLLLHLLCVLLAFGWLRRRSAESWWPALCGAALFALHPSRPESVAWISGATDLWMALFTLLALRTWDLYRCGWSALGTGVLLLLALWSKETAVVVPALLWIDIQWGPGTDRKKPRRDLSIVAGVVVAALGTRALMAPLTSGADYPAPLSWLAQVAAAFGQYLSCLAWPWPVSTQVGIRVLGADGVEVFSPVILGVGVVGLVGGIAFIVSAARQPRLRPLAADLAWLVLPLLPVLHLIPLGTRWLVAYRYLYLPMLGAACLLSRWLAANPNPPGNRNRALVVAIILASFGMGSAQHVGYFASEKTLWTYERSLNPGSLVAAERLGAVHAKAGDHDKALELWRDGALQAQRQNNPEMTALFRLLLARHFATRAPAWDRATLLGWHRFYQTLATEGVAEAPMADAPFKVDLRGPHGEGLKKHPERFSLPHAICALRAGDVAGAETLLVNLTKSPKASALAWRERIRAHGLRFRWKAAFATLKTAMEKFGETAELVDLQARLRKARFTYAKNGPEGMPAKASTLLRDAHVLSMLGGGHLAKTHVNMLLPNFAHLREVWITLAQLELSLGNYIGAEKILKRAVEENPENSGFWQEQIRQLQIQMKPPSP